MICFKRCPYLRTVITEIIAVVWKSGRVPSAWKRACTILVHKKGDHDDPANFRPITLQSVPLKIFTSCLHDTIFSFLKQNGFIEQRIQKGFTHGVSGVLEHTSMMGHVINKARLKQRSVVITLLDLKNAFGEVHHNLINSFCHITIFLKLFSYSLQIFIQVFTHPSFLIVSLLRLFPFSVECYRVIVLAPFCSTCALAHLYNSSSKKNILT